MADLSTQLAEVLSDTTKALASATQALADSLQSVSVPLASGKRSKTAVSYRTAGDGDGHCSTCVYYHPASRVGAGNTCDEVNGSIDPDATCMLFKMKQARVTVMRMAKSGD